MTCSKCKNNFCWLCLQLLSSHINTKCRSMQTTKEMIYIGIAFLLLVKTQLSSNFLMLDQVWKLMQATQDTSVGSFAYWTVMILIANSSLILLNLREEWLPNSQKQHEICLAMILVGCLLFESVLQILIFEVCTLATGLIVVLFGSSLLILTVVLSPFHVFVYILKLFGIT